MSDAESQDRSSWLRDAFQRYETRLVRYASSLLGDVDRARDVAQDTFVRLCGQEPEQLDGHLAPWLFRVCRNRALDVQKKELRMTPLNDEKAVSCEDRQSDPTRAVESRESAECANALLSSLPDSQQEVIRLKIELGLKYREISEVTGLSVSNVGYLLHQGIRSIREQLAEVSAGD